MLGKGFPVPVNLKFLHSKLKVWKVQIESLDLKFFNLEGKRSHSKLQILLLKLFYMFTPIDSRKATLGL